MIELTRKLHPVGQGGFYTETFKNFDNYNVFKMVYDCGSETNKPRDISTYLDGYIKKNDDKIDAVFISHLHYDHINGLDNLLRKGVKYLFLPQLTPNVIIEAYLYNYIKTGDNNALSNKCIANLIQNKYKTKIIQIKEIKEYNGDQISGNGVEINDELKENYDSGTRFIIHKNVLNPNGESPIKWLYIPFNSPWKTKNGKDISEDSFFKSAKNAKEVIVPKKLMELIKKEGVDKCKKVYKEYFITNHNEYSMTLFSGVENPGLNRIIGRKSCGSSYRCNYQDLPNFLYTGDFEPNNKLGTNAFVDVMKKHLDDLWETISGIQVPHHGSKNNYNSELYHYPCRAYISVGSDNKYHHPNAETLVNIQKECCNSIIVSEDLSSMQEEVYELRSRWK